MFLKINSSCVFCELKNLENIIKNLTFGLNINRMLFDLNLYLSEFTLQVQIKIYRNPSQEDCI